MEAGHRYTLWLGIHWFKDSFLFFFFLNWWGLIMLLGWLKLLSPITGSQVAGITVMCHYPKVYANFHVD